MSPPEERKLPFFGGFFLQWKKIEFGKQFWYNNDTSVKRSKSCSCLHDKAFELGTRKYEKVAIYEVNQRISNI